MLFIRTAAVFAAAAAIQPVSVSFEPKPRAVVSGRDPQIAVRASGALSLLKVESGDVLLQTSFDGGDSFEPPVRVNNVAGEVSSHGENSPQMVLRTRSEFYVLWQARGAGLRFARSLDWGETFLKAIDVDAPAAGASQSFYALNVSPTGAIYVSWLDGRDRAQGRPGTAAVYIARSSNRGASFEKPVRVALDSCPCCRPNIAFGGDGSIHVAWRRVLDGNIRDIFVSTSRDGGVTWNQPVRVAEDNWILNGCPHSGASMAALGKRLFIAWHTVREQKPQLSVAYSDDGGQTFSRRYGVSDTVLDSNHPFLAATGDRVSLLFQGRDSKQNQGWGVVNVYYREIDSQMKVLPLQRVGSAGASASYPVFAFEEPNRFYVAWTEAVKDAKQIVMARGRRVSNAR